MKIKKIIKKIKLFRTELRIYMSMFDEEFKKMTPEQRAKLLFQFYNTYNF